MKKFAALIVVALIVSIGVTGISVYDEMRRGASSDPRVWEQQVKELEATFITTPPPRDAVVFVGDSHIRLWHSLAADMAPLAVIQSGFGGARINAVLHYADRVITRHVPAKVVIVTGANDINNSDTPMQDVPRMRDDLRRLITVIRAARADTEIFYLGIPPGIHFRDKWEATQAANHAAAALCAEYPGVTFVESADLFLDDDGQPIKKLYQYDGLHASTEGYQRLTGRIKPLLLAQ